ncbi:protein disabled-like isoform X4 [Penaeus japonicus]|uniref:protein disabled-like isoform X4 n=1 Tax=Penaeus japonicus TaxID=27405 RepID=UPI001C70E2FB|nr:protein disabled-like isoform X4 [Penaeus japonicus]
MSQVFPGSHGGRGGGDGDGDRDDAQAADAAAELIDESPRGSSSSASGCGADGCGRGGGAGGVEEGAPPLPSRPPPPSLEQQQQQDVPEGWARFSWVVPVPKRLQLQQPQPQAGSFAQRGRSQQQKGGAARRLQHSQSQPHLHQQQRQQQPPPSSPGSLRQQGHLHRLKHLQLQHQQSLPAKQTSRLHPYGSSLKRSKQGKQGRLHLRPHHDEDDGDGDGEAAAARLVHSSSGSSSSLNSRVSVASNKSSGNKSNSGGSGGSGVSASGSGSPSVANMSGSGTSGAAASYSTLRRGLKVTTSKIMSATSTVRRQPSSPAASAVAKHFHNSNDDNDRQGGSEKNDPHRFVEGMSFKGKLIGVLEVSEARGDRMCQDALAELKMAVRAAGEHKQRILISVAMDGIRLRDERSSDCLYHHPVHKISFIAQDMTDSRAFGYIFGSPDAGHKFFGIKTEKAASQVVIAMRDLFQVVFELKKKEIEKARSQLEGGRDRGESRDSSFGALFGSNGDSGIEGEQIDPFGDSFKPTFASTDTSKPRITASTAPTPAPLAPPPVSGRTRHDSHHSGVVPHQHTASTTPGSTQDASSGDFAKFPVNFPDVTKSPPPAQTPLPQTAVQARESHEDRYAAFKEFRTVNNGSFNDFSDARFCEGQESETSGALSIHQADEFDAQWIKAEASNESHLTGSKQSHYDVFTDLDPLGTGKNRPYVDKRDFFSEMRKPAKRVLRELGDGEASAPNSPRTQPGVIPPEVSALVASTSLYSTTSRSASVTATRPTTSTNTTPIHSTSVPSHPFTESFSPPDSFGPEDFQFHQATEKDFYDATNFSSGFADFNTFHNDSPRSQRSEMSSSIPDEPPPPLPCGPLTVALPPESFRDSPPPFSPPPVPKSPERMASGPGSPQLSHHPHHSPVPQARLSKQIMASSISPKTLPRSHKFRKQSSFENEWNVGDTGHLKSFTSGELTPPTPPQLHSEGGLSPRPRPRSHLSKQLSASSATLALRPSHSRYSDAEQFSSPELESRPFPTDDLNLSYEEAPKPPPRPAHIEPPPLPPKRQPTHVVLRPPPRPPPSSDPHYNYINEYDSSPEGSNTPPIPIPARKPRYPESAAQPAFIPSRSTKPSHPDSFQFPKPSLSPTHDVGRNIYDVGGAVPKTSRDSTPSKSSTPGKSPRLIQKSTASVDLANTSLDQLAASLDMPVEQLARMTVVELAACLAQLQLRQGGDLENQAKEDVQTHGMASGEHSGRRSRASSRDHSRDRFAFDEDEMFAKFDAQFPKSPVEPPEFSVASNQQSTLAVGAPVSEDRYAVFRELSTTVNKQKSVFDENFLTPQNSMDEEVSEVSSGTFKANFESDLRKDSLDRKSSLSDDGELGELEKDKDWHPPNHDLECVTVFRSPEISEYDNFEPTFDAKFDDDFSAATLSEKSITPVNSPTPQRYTSPRPQRKQIEAHKSPFTDDFSSVSISSKQTSGRQERTESETSFASFDDNFVPPTEGDKYSNYQDFTGSGRVSRQDSQRKSPFVDNFIDSKGKDQIEDSGFTSGFGDSTDTFDDPFTSVEPKSRSASRGSSEMMKVSMERETTLQPPVDTSVTKRKSPFDDDFTNRGDRYEVLKEVESEREPSLEGEVSRLTRQSDARGSPFEDSWHGSQRNTPFDDQKSIGSLHSIQGEHRNIPQESPFEDDFNGDSRKASVDQGRLSRTGSENRKSPFGDSFTPPSSGRAHRNRIPSRLSVESEGSDVRHSPFEDNFSSIIGSVAEEVTFDAFPSLPQDTSVTSEAEEVDPFSVKLNKAPSKSPEGDSDSHFADFEHAFQQSEGEDPKQSQEDPAESTSAKSKTPQPAEEVLEDDIFPDDETEFKISARYVTPTPDMKKSDSVNIFRRNSDPFADDFFCADGEGGNAPGPVKPEDDPFWEKPFDNFSFPVDQ